MMRFRYPLSHYFTVFKLFLIWKIKNIIWFFVKFFPFRTQEAIELPIQLLEVECSDNSRYVNNELMVIECTPCKRTIFAYDNAGDIVNHRLTFPYIYFIVRYGKSHPDENHTYYLFSSLKVCFSKKQLKDSNGFVGKLPISNYYDNGEELLMNYCLGDGTPRGSYNTLKELGDKVISGFWQTAFQMHVDKKWEKCSNADNYGYISNMIVFEKRIKDLIGGLYVTFKEYRYQESTATSRIGPNGYKKRIRRKHKKQGAGG